jgi:hypothetical protein
VLVNSENRSLVVVAFDYDKPSEVAGGHCQTKCTSR